MQTRSKTRQKLEMNGANPQSSLSLVFSKVPPEVLVKIFDASFTELYHFDGWIRGKAVSNFDTCLLYMRQLALFSRNCCSAIKLSKISQLFFTLIKSEKNSFYVNLLYPSLHGVISSSKDHSDLITLPKRYQVNLVF